MTSPTAKDVIDAVGGLPGPENLEHVLLAGGDPNAKIDGRPALDHAVTLGYEDKVQLLLRHGADPNMHEDPDPLDDGRFVTPLIVATRNDTRLRIIKQLLAAGANPNQCDDLGMTPLMCAASFGAAAAFNLLLESGANPGSETSDGQTALHFVMVRDSPDIVRRLIQLGLDPKKPSAGGGLSPAQLAQKRGHTATIAVLKELGYI